MAKAGNARNPQREVALRIVLERPPAGVDFALQKGRGSACQAVQKQRSGNADLVFECAVEVRTSRTDDSPDFSSALVQGPPGGRFIYIDIGAFAGQDSCWNRRLKVPLRGITREMLDGLADNPRAVLEARVPGAGKDGGPNCGTVKPFAGWKPGRA
jgi:hypothetical protein